MLWLTLTWKLLQIHEYKSLHTKKWIQVVLWKLVLFIYNVQRQCWVWRSRIISNVLWDKIERLNENLPVWSLIFILWSNGEWEIMCPPLPPLFHICSVSSLFNCQLYSTLPLQFWILTTHAWRHLTLSLTHHYFIK